MAFRMPRGMALVNVLLGGWSALVLLFLYLPIFVVIAYSFNESRTGVEFPSLTLKWYRELFLVDRYELLRPLKNSLIIAAIVTAVSSVLGTVGAWLLYQYRYKFDQMLATLILTPMIVPEVIMGVSFLLLFKNLYIEDGFTRTTIAHITFCFPYVLIAVQARLSGLDPSLMEAAMDLGAPPVKAFFKVIVPYLLPAIISGALMSFTLSMDEVVVTWFTYDDDSRTLPVRVFEMARLGYRAELNVISALMVFATVILIVVAQWLTLARADRKIR
jgi:spermidine/putrescine transport system permease protein